MATNLAHRVVLMVKLDNICKKLGVVSDTY